MTFEQIKEKVKMITYQANVNIRKDVFSLIKKAYLKERRKKARLALGWIIENAKIAQRDELPVCQDTGLPIVFIEIPEGLKNYKGLIKTIEEGVRQAYKENFFRKSIVEPLKRGTPEYGPALLHLEVSSSPFLKIVIFPKGFGSENKSRLYMFNPSDSLGEIEDFVVRSVKEAGPEACPPFFVGIGIGGSSDYALLLAKKALLERMDIPSKNKEIARIEARILKKINRTGIGPMGLGGKFTALGVKIKTAPVHIAGLPVGVNISCWALRSKQIRLKITSSL